MDDFALAFLQACRDKGKDPVAMVKLASAISPHIAKSLAGIEKEALGIPTGTQNLINASNMIGKQEAINPLPQSKPLPQPNIAPSPHVRSANTEADAGNFMPAVAGGLRNMANVGLQQARGAVGMTGDAIRRATPSWLAGGMPGMNGYSAPSGPVRPEPGSLSPEIMSQIAASDAPKPDHPMIPLPAGSRGLGAGAPDLRDAQQANRESAPWLSGEWMSPATRDAFIRQEQAAGQAFNGDTGGARGAGLPTVNTNGQVGDAAATSVNTNGAATSDQRSAIRDHTMMNSELGTDNGPHQSQGFAPLQDIDHGAQLAHNPALGEGQRTALGVGAGTLQGAIGGATTGNPLLTGVGGGLGAMNGWRNIPSQEDAVRRFEYNQAAAKGPQPELTAEQMGLPGSQPTPPAPETPAPDLNKFEDLVSQVQSNPQYIQQLSEKGDGYLQSAMDVNIPPEQRQEAFAMGAQHKLALASVEAGVPAAEKVQQISEQGLSPQDAVAAAEKAAPNDPEAQAGIFEQVGQMPDWAQVLMWGGLGLGAVGLFQQLFGGDDEGGGGGLLPMLMTLLGIGGAGYAAVQGGLVSNPFGGGGEQPPADPGATGGVAPQGLGVNSMMMGLGAGNLGGMAARMPGLRGLLTSGVESGVQGVTGLKPEILREMVKGMSPQQLEQYAAQIAQPAAERGMDPMQLQGLLQNYHTAIQ